jgi:hypothetical protein
LHLAVRAASGFPNTLHLHTDPKPHSLKAAALHAMRRFTFFLSVSLTGSNRDPFRLQSANIKINRPHQNRYLLNLVLNALLGISVKYSEADEQKYHQGY